MLIKCCSNKSINPPFNTCSWSVGCTQIYWGELTRQRADDALTKSLLCQNDVATSFWRNNDDAIASCARWEASDMLERLVTKFIKIWIKIQQFSFKNTESTFTWVILWMRPAHARRHYNVTSSLIGWARSQNDPCLQNGGHNRTRALTNIACSIRTPPNKQQWRCVKALFDINIISHSLVVMRFCDNSQMSYGTYKTMALCNTAVTPLLTH